MLGTTGEGGGGRMTEQLEGTGAVGTLRETERGAPGE